MCAYDVPIITINCRKCSAAQVKRRGRSGREAKEGKKNTQHSQPEASFGAAKDITRVLKCKRWKRSAPHRAVDERRKGEENSGETAPRYARRPCVERIFRPLFSTIAPFSPERMSRSMPEINAHTGAELMIVFIAITSDFSQGNRRESENNTSRSLLKRYLCDWMSDVSMVLMTKSYSRNLF